jgi:hypothetical protein
MICRAAGLRLNALQGLRGMDCLRSQRAGARAEPSLPNRKVRVGQGLLLLVVIVDMSCLACRNARRERIGWMRCGTGKLNIVLLVLFFSRMFASCMRPRGSRVGALRIDQSAVAGFRMIIALACCGTGNRGAQGVGAAGSRRRRGHVAQARIEAGWSPGERWGHHPLQKGRSWLVFSMHAVTRRRPCRAKPH